MADAFGVIFSTQAAVQALVLHGPALRDPLALGQGRSTVPAQRLLRGCLRQYGRSLPFQTHQRRSIRLRRALAAPGGIKPTFLKTIDDVSRAETTGGRRNEV
jgi:hypothetical protein